MTDKHLEEGEIAEKIRSSLTDKLYYSYRPKEFVAHQTNGKWRISFNYLNEDGYALHLKRGGIREFANLKAVENCLRKIRVTEFKVIL